MASRGLGQQVPQKLLESPPDARTVLRAVLRAWLPLSEAVLGMAVEHLPSPAAAAPLRVPRLLAGGSNTALLEQQQHHHGQLSSSCSSVPPEVAQQLERTYSHLCASSSSSDAPLVIFVSKMVSVPANLLPRRPGEPAAPGNAAGEVFLAFGRVFSGVAREGARVHVLHAAYDPTVPGRQRQSAVLRGLYLMMGRCVPGGALPRQH